MLGPSPYFVNGGVYYIPAAGRNFIIMGFNYERWIGEMLEDYGHRTESIMTHVYGSWNAYPPQHNWDLFTLVDKNITNRKNYTAGCGNVHFAPNSTADYQWGNYTNVYSTCDDWLDWSTLNGHIVMLLEQRLRTRQVTYSQVPSGSAACCRRPRYTRRSHVLPLPWS